MSRDIDLLYPQLQKIIFKFLKECRDRGLKVKITDTFRDEEEQNKLYDQGRTKPGNIVTFAKYPYSYHNWGLAFDICRNDGKGAYNNDDRWFEKVSEVGKSMGLKWGGDWKDKADKPHFEFDKFGGVNSLIKKYKTPEKFIKTWEPLDEECKDRFVYRSYSYNGKTKLLKVINENDEYYIKVRDLAELLNKKVKFDSITKVTYLEDTIKNILAIVNDKEYEIKAINSDDFNYMNAREIGNALGYDVEYDKYSKKIHFKIKD